MQLADPRITERTLVGPFFPGDLAVRRADGLIRIFVRSADMVNFRGHKVAVAPMAVSIQHHLYVDNTCLFSGINSEGEEVVIAIESAQWPKGSALSHLGHELGKFGQVRFAIVYPFLRPQTGMSKIDRVALRKLVYPVF